MNSEIYALIIQDIEKLSNHRDMIARHFNVGIISMTSYRETLIEVNRAIEQRFEILKRN